MATVIDVAVIGAGLAGLQTAKLLQEGNRSVVVLEARERVGGRVHTVRTDRVAIDLGAQWVGPEQKRVMALVSRLGLTLIKTHYKGKHRHSSADGYVSSRFMIPPLGVVGTLDFANVFMKMERGASKLRGQASGQAMEGALGQLPFREWIRDQARRPTTADAVETLLEGLFCCDLRNISVAEVLSQLHSIGGLGPLERAETYFIEQGAQALALGLARELPGVIHCGEPVIRLTTAQNGEVILQTHARVVHAKQVVVAVPPQLHCHFMVSNESKGGDELPRTQADTRAMSDLYQCGDVIKCVAVYEKPWWRDRGLSGVALRSSGPPIVMLDTSHGEAGVLVTLFAGSAAAALRSVGPGQRRQRVTEAIQLALGDGAQPLHFESCDWASEQWSLGGFASRPRLDAGQMENPKNVGASLLATSVASVTQSVHYAGTETALEWRSYMEGALESAERIASQLLGQRS